jgi:hypothetical protein
MNEKIKSFIEKLNRSGIPLPMIRDPKTKEGSVTLTLVFISFNTALIGQIGKVAGVLGGVDLTQANYLFLMCLGAYLGRKMQGDGKKVEIEGDNLNGKKE